MFSTYTDYYTTGHSPCIGVNQDSLVGAYLLTNDNVMLTKKQMMHILMWNETFTGKLPKPDNGKFWTGKQLISTILPNISLNMIDTDSEPHIKTVIKDGILVEGRLHKNSLGAGSGGIVHNIINDFNAKDAKLFLDSEQGWYVLSCYIIIVFQLVLVIV